MSASLVLPKKRKQAARVLMLRGGPTNCQGVAILWGVPLNLAILQQTFRKEKLEHNDILILEL